MRVKIRTVKGKTHTSVVLDFVHFNGKRRKVIMGKARTKEDLEPILQEAKRTANLTESVLSDSDKYGYFLTHLVHKTFWPVQRACMLLLGEVEFRRYSIIEGAKCQFRLPDDHPIVLSFAEEVRRFEHFDGKLGFKPIPTEDGVAVLQEDFVKFAVRAKFGDYLPGFVRNLGDFIERAGFFGFADQLPGFVEEPELGPVWKGSAVEWLGKRFDLSGKRKATLMVEALCKAREEGGPGLSLKELREVANIAGKSSMHDTMKHIRADSGEDYHSLIETVPGHQRLWRLTEPH